MPEKVRIFSDAQAIQSERASDFDVYSAYGEIIDNSIEADALNINIKFSTSVDKSRGKNFLHINSVAFGDDGIGMDIDTLHHCLQLGYSTRYGSRKGIGRFGVGMTKGAISQCKKIEIYSKEEKAPKWSYTYFDIDDIENKIEAIIPDPVYKSIPEEYHNLIGTKKGTLVILSKIDKQDKSANEIIEESKIWMGRTYRKFIFNKIKIIIDGQEIKAIDPLYLHPEYTAYPSDPKAIKYGEDILEWEIDDPDIRNKGGVKKSKIIIRYSLLPKKFMEYGRRIAGDHADNKNRFVDRNEGISILRNDREVRDPNYDIPYWKPKFKEVDRFWGCEICFNAELDNWFQVRNIKRGAAPFKELREELERQVNPKRSSMVKEVQKYWDELEQPAPLPPGIDIDPKHGESTKIAVDTYKETKPKDPLNKNKEPESEIDKFVKSRFGKLAPDKAKAFVEYFRKNQITILESPSHSTNFFEITHFGNGKSNIAYNTTHVFCNKYFEILKNLNSNQDNPNLDQHQILILIDLLLIAYSSAESQFDPDATLKAEVYFEDMMREWGRFLRDLLKTWSEYERR